jgi:hypothetical protein
MRSWCDGAGGSVEPRAIDRVGDKSGRGEAVHTVYESCGFGYTLHEELCTAGAGSLVTTPMRLNLERRRKNDRMDARHPKRGSTTPAA